MMKKYLFLLLLGAVSLASCSKENPERPELNKLSRVNCYKNGSLTPEFTMEIAYNSNGQIAHVIENNAGRRQFIYAENSITVADLNAEAVTTSEYTLSGETILRLKVSATNPYKRDEVYVRDEYNYGYSGSYWDRTNWTATIAKSDGTYETRTYANDQQFAWNEGNVARFTRDKSDMVYEYDLQQRRPSSFPFRVIATFRPVGLDMFWPLNLQFGDSNRHLPVRAYWTNFPDTQNKRAEYAFSYIIVGDYVTGMSIDEQIHAQGTVEKETNTYLYTFEYATR